MGTVVSGCCPVIIKLPDIHMTQFELHANILIFFDGEKMY